MLDQSFKFNAGLNKVNGSPNNDKSEGRIQKI